jgi:DNA ligase D
MDDNGATVSDNMEIETSGRVVTISNPDRLYFPALGATKRDLAEYYVAVDAALMNTACRRPALLERFPDGAEGKSFFQKRVPPHAPEWLETTVVSTPNGTRSNALVVADVAHVLWAVNLGCLGLHLWPFRVDDAAHADELRIDLDPQPGTGFDDARRAARLTCALLDELGIAGYPKTTGNRGIHVYVRLEPRWDSTAVRAAAVSLARELERRHPEFLTARWWKEERGRRVFVDFNQNAPHKTVFGAWFARPRSTGQVSTPFAWDELDTVDPESLTIYTVPARLRERGDPWAEIAAAPQSLDPLLELAAADRASGLMDAPWPPEYPKAPEEPTRVSPSRARKPD